MKSPGETKDRTRSRSALSGEMKAASTTVPASRKSRATSPTRRIFSSRSAMEKPRSQHKPCRTLSPSRIKVRTRRACSLSSSALASVDFPDPEKPVNQMIRARWPCSTSLSPRETAACCQMRLFGDKSKLDEQAGFLNYAILRRNRPLPNRRPQCQIVEYSSVI